MLGSEQEVAVELGHGRAIHHVLRHLPEDTKGGGDIPDSHTLANLLEREFYRPFANAPAFERMYSAARRLVNRYVNDCGDDL